MTDKEKDHKDLQLQKALLKLAEARQKLHEFEKKVNEPIAVIGLAGRFPGAENADVFFQNILNGVESITYFDETTLLEAGVSSEQLSKPNYVRAKGIIPDYDLFDARFFNFSHKQAELMDPQIRLFLETIWQAMEDAGYHSEERAGKIGVFAGMGSFYNHFSYLQSRLGPSKTFSDLYQLVTNNANDYLATRISYQFNFTGPSITMQTACSTSLMAIIEACTHLLNRNCDMALAGGVALGVPMNMGYNTEEGSVLSPDGHCRPFDADGNGTVLSNGVGAVVLKRYEDALRDHDSIYAVIKGFACNNDGSSKVSYTAPSFEKQAVVIEEALLRAGVNPEQISLYEAHATATPLGDPIEISAATKAYRKWTTKSQYCPIGSVKGNIGHLDSAAGIAAFIKMVLAIKHKKIPPSINFKTPYPKMQIESSPFYVSMDLKDWEISEGLRMGAVSSFGIGGTNAHLILSEAPAESNEVKPESTEAREVTLTISAKSEEALKAYIQKYIEYFQHTPHSLQDIAYSLMVARPLFEHKISIRAKSKEEAAEKLRSRDFVSEIASVEINSPNLHKRVPLPAYPFQRQRYLIEIPSPESIIDHVAVHPLLGEMHSHPDGSISFYGKLNLASLPYVRDHIVFGHCILPGTGFIEIMIAAGSYVLNHKSVSLNNISFEAALSLEVGKSVNIQLLMKPVENGAYEIGIFTQREDLSWICHARSMVSAGEHVKDAPTLDIKSVKARCQKSSLNQSEFYEYINATGLTLGALFQSIHALYEGEKETLGELMLSVSAEGYLAHPALLDGCLMDGCAPLSRRGIEEDPSKKGLYLPVGCDRVEFYAPLGDHIFSYAQETELSDTARTINIKIYHPDGKLLARLDGFHLRKTTATALQQVLSREVAVSDWLYEWKWQDDPQGKLELPPVLGKWLILGEESYTSPLVELLSTNGAICRCITRENHPKNTEEFLSVLQEENFSGILHMSSIGDYNVPDANTIREAQLLGSRSVLHLTQALIQLEEKLKIPTYLITQNVGFCNIAQSPLIGLYKTIFLEYPRLPIKLIDAEGGVDNGRIFEAIFSKNESTMFLIRKHMTYTPALVKIKIPKMLNVDEAFSDKIHANATYLITGGLGGLGLTVAQWLFDNGAKHLVLTGRTGLNDRIKLNLDSLKSEGHEIHYEKLDVSDEKAVSVLLDHLQKNKNPLKGIFHLGGVIEDASLLEQDWSHFETVFAAKVYGSFYLHHYSRDLDLFVTFSSIASLLGSPGQSNYAAANAFMDALCEYRRQEGMPAHSVCWGPWAEVGMASGLASRYTRAGFLGLKSVDGMRALKMALLLPQANIGIASINWKNYLKPLIVTPSWLDMFAEEKITQDSLSARLKAGTSSDSSTIIQHYVMEVVRAVLGVPSTEVIDEKMGFFDMGLDSLMAVDLKNRLQEGIGEDIRLGSTIVFDYSSVAKMTEHLASKLGIHSREKVSEIPSHVQSEDQKMTNAVEALSDEEAMRKLREELGDE